LRYNACASAFILRVIIASGAVVISPRFERVIRRSAVAGSLLLVAACILAARYLNQSHRRVSLVLTENVASMVADKELETTLDELPFLLRADHSRLDLLTAELTKRHEKAEQQLKQVHDYANTPEESSYVQKVEESWRRYKESWRKRPSTTSREELMAYDGHLALQLDEDLLLNCSRLLEHNTRQVKEANDADRRLVDQLTWGLLTVGIGAPLAGWLLGYAVARRMHQSMLQLSVQIRDAAGRLNSELRPVTVERDGAFSALNRQMAGIIDEIERVFERLNQREREVLRAEQLAAVGQVAAGVAHELRNPLTSVKMLVQTGLEGAPPPGLPAEDLGIIEHEIRRMEACIQTFLDFARPPSAARRRTDLLAVIRRAIYLLDGRARRQHVTLKTDLPLEPVELLIDPEQIHQVLVNLMLNALDAMPHGGEVRLQVRPTSDPPGAKVSVHDTGTGIAAPVLARLFEPFISSKETGLGLGLSICRRLLETNGGSIKGENDPAGGAVFTFTLPA
jgi:two-component system, NtrC family, sensor histidine kinase HydH